MTYLTIVRQVSLDFSSCREEKQGFTQDCWRNSEKGCSYFARKAAGNEEGEVVRPRQLILPHHPPSVDDQVQVETKDERQRYEVVVFVHKTEDELGLPVFRTKRETHTFGVGQEKLSAFLLPHAGNTSWEIYHPFT